MSDLTGLIHLMDAKGKRLPDAAGMALFHDHWNELRAGLLKADAEIERLNAIVNDPTKLRELIETRIAQEQDDAEETGTEAPDVR